MQNRIYSVIYANANETITKNVISLPTSINETAALSAPSPDFTVRAIHDVSPLQSALEDANLPF